MQRVGRHVDALDCSMAGLLLWARDGVASAQRHDGWPHCARLLATLTDISYRQTGHRSLRHAAHRGDHE